MCDMLYEIVGPFIYVILAVMFGMSKALDIIEERGYSFSVKNIVKLTIVYSIAFPGKMIKDINFKSKKNNIFGRKS